MTPRASRGDVWLATLDPTRGHEQAGTRPVVVISTDLFNHGGSALVVIAPITSVGHGVRWQVEVQPPEGGLRQLSFIQCDALRSISTERLQMRWGALSWRTMAEIEDRLRILIEL